MMIGKRFGKLVVIARADDTYTKANTVIDWWICKCDCGTEYKVRGASLRNGHTSSCGCYRLEMLASETYQSRYEQAVATMLANYGITYEPQKTFSGLYGLGGNLLSYDFCVKINDNLFLIELNGLQHYEPVKFFGGNQVYGRQRVHDYRKEQFAKENNYPLLVVKCIDTTVDEVCNNVLTFLRL